MTPFRQLILPGDQGTDVLAIKRAVRAMGVKGSGGLIVTGKGKKRAGAALVSVLETVQRQHHLHADGKYGKQTHAVIAPHFDAWGVLLYKAAKIRDRTPPPPPLYQMTARQAAAELLELARVGRYHADNPGDLRDLQATAAGRPVWSALGRFVYIDPRPLRLLLWLITVHGYRIGTFALCSDHHNDGPHGHAGGLAFDISSINGVSVGGPGAHDLTRAVATHIRSAPAGLRPRQMICAGSGGFYYSDIEALCIPYASYYGRDLGGHRNHTHCGF